MVIDEQLPPIRMLGPIFSIRHCISEGPCRCIGWYWSTTIWAKIFVHGCVTTPTDRYDCTKSIEKNGEQVKNIEKSDPFDAVEGVTPGFCESLWKVCFETAVGNRLLLTSLQTSRFACLCLEKNYTSLLLEYVRWESDWTPLRAFTRNDGSICGEKTAEPLLDQLSSLLIFVQLAVH